MVKIDDKAFKHGDITLMWSKEAVSCQLGDLYSGVMDDCSSDPFVY
jgi:hypothetical protein